MKKHILYHQIILCLTACLIAAGCSRKASTGSKETGNSDNSVNADSSAVSPDAPQQTEAQPSSEEKSVSAEGSGASSESSETSSASSHSDVDGILVKNASDYVSLCDFTKLQLTRTVQIASDEEIRQRMISSLDLEEEVRQETGPIQNGDQVEMDLYILDGDTVIDQWEDCIMYIGEELFSPEFDEAMTAYRAGDDFSFTVSYQDSYYDEELAGKDITYQGTVRSVESVTEPEITTEIIQEKTSYDTVEEYTQYIKGIIQEEYDLAADMLLRSNAISTVTDASTFTGSWPQELYDQCEKEEEFLNASGFSFGDQDTVTDLVNQRLVISALFEEEQLSMTADELHEIQQQISSELGYDTIDDYKAVFVNDDAVLWDACERKAADYLTGKMEIIDNVLDYSEEDLAVPSDSETDAGEVIMGLAEGGVPVE